MAERLKKKPSFFNIKRWNGQKPPEGPPSPQTPIPRTPQIFTPIYKSNNSPSILRNANSSASEPKPRKMSAGGIKELVQCTICLEVLHNPKMLPCQHTFCAACLIAHIADQTYFECPMCKQNIHITRPNYVNELPSNLYIDSLLKLVGISNDEQPQSATPPTSPATAVNVNARSVDLFAAGIRCSHCKTMCDSFDITSCQHCKLNFCRVCWSQHLDDLQSQIGSILKQLDRAANQLEHKMDYFKDRCERIIEQINVVADHKINAIKETKDHLLNEAVELSKTGDMTALALKTSLSDAKTVASQAMTNKEVLNDTDKVSTFMNLHQNALQILTDVNKWDTDRFVFDKENFRIELDASTPLDAESDDPVPETTKQNNPLYNEDSLILYYRSRNFIPHYTWRKTARPAGIGVSPWNNHLYICGMDSHCVIVVERTYAKIVTRLSCDEMLCPIQIAFMDNLEEIYVSDKWKHCIHVFSKNGNYLRSIGQKGSRLGMFRSPEGLAVDNESNLIYVVDTGNDRVQILEADGKVVDQIGIAVKKQPSDTGTIWDIKEVACTEFNAPTSVAVTKDRVVILDGGNRRVKVYNKQDKNKLVEFGSLGYRKGHFRQPEVLAVDPMGFILVGDSGNSRIQVFKPTGQLVRVFGGLGTEPGKFGWISGIHVTDQLDIIISDTKNHSVNFF